MSVDPAIQSAPERRGIIKAATDWATGTATPSSLGKYKGDDSKTYTFTAQDSGTIGTTASIQVTWSDGTNTGTLEIGTDVGYTAGDDVPVDSDGLTVAFAAGTTVATETFTVAVVAGNFPLDDREIIETDVEPSRLYLVTTAAEDRDNLIRTESQNIRRDVRQKARAPSFLLDYALSAQREKWLGMVHRNHDVTLGENYDADTIFLWRGGGLIPMIGPKVTFTRSNSGAYLDRDSGLWKIAAANELRIVEGPNGPAFIKDVATTNQDQNFHAKTGTTGWTNQSGSVATAPAPDVDSVLHRDGGWTDDFLDHGPLRALFDNTEAIRSTTQPAATAGNNYAAQVYLKGMGNVDVEIYDDSPAGGGTPITSIASETVDLDTHTWQRVVIDGAAGTNATIRHLRITANRKSHVLIGPKQQELGFTATALIETDGGTATRNAETITIDDLTLPPVFSLSMFFKIAPGSIDTAANPFSLFEYASSGVLAVHYDTSGTDQLLFYTTSSSPLTHDITLATETWYHLVVTLGKGSSSDNVDRAIYIRSIGGSLESSTDSSSNWEDTGWAGPFEIGKSDASYDEFGDWAFAEIRIDGREWTQAEVTAQYERFANDDWKHLHQELAGRRFHIGRHSERQLHTAVPDKYEIAASLVQKNTEPHSLVHP